MLQFVLFAVIKYFEKKQLTGKGFVSGSQFKCAVQHGRKEPEAAGHKASIVKTEKTDIHRLVLSSFPLLLFILNPYG